jgi:hypothetical protein
MAKNLDLLSEPAAISYATTYLRRPVTAEEFDGWVARGLHSKSPPTARVPLFDIRDLDRFLACVADAEKLLTVREAAEYVERRYGIRVGPRAVRDWMPDGRGYPKSDGSRVYLPYVHSPVFRPSSRLVRPADLDAFVQAVGPNLGRRGRPLVRGR